MYPRKIQLKIQKIIHIKKMFVDCVNKYPTIIVEFGIKILFFAV